VLYNLCVLFQEHKSIHKGKYPFAFVPYGLGLKDERPTSNVQSRQGVKKTKIEYRTDNVYFFIFSHSMFFFSNPSWKKT